MLTACVERGPSVAYRLTLTLEEGGKQYTGSSVVQINPTMSYDLASQRSYDANLRGTATFVRLPGQQVAAALLGSWGSGNYSEPFSYFKAKGKPVHLTEDQLPSIAVFKDPSKPASAYYLFLNGNGRGYTGDSDIRVTDAEIEQVESPPSFQVPVEMSWLQTLTWKNDNVATGRTDCLWNEVCISKRELISGK